MSEIRHTSTAPTRTKEHRSGESIDRHRHDDHQVMYVSAGVVEMTTAFGSWIAPPQRALWVPAGQWHEHVFHGASRSHTVGFDPETDPLRTAEPAVLLVGPLLRELIVTYAGGLVDGDEERRLRSVLIDQLRRARHDSLHVPLPRSPVLANACAIVLADLSTPRTIADLGAEVGASARTLSRLFQVELTTSYPQWRTQARLAQAVRELAEGRSVTQVSTSCGWSSPSAFIDAYRRNLGHTPGRAMST